MSFKTIKVLNIFLDIPFRGYLSGGGLSVASCRLCWVRINVSSWLNGKYSIGWSSNISCAVGWI
jgi:hypothetical protein